MLGKILYKLRRWPPFGFWKQAATLHVGHPLLWDNRRHIHIGRNVEIRENSWLSPIAAYAGERFDPRLVIEDNVYIGRYACITCIQGVTIGQGSVLSEHVYIADNGHGLDPRAGLIMKQPLVSKGPVKIGSNCFIGYGARVMPGVSLGANCIVGANAVVTRSYPSGTMLAGIPARPIKLYNPTSGEWEAC